jgi:hypothetical protein
MALNNSGPLSFGGSTVGQSINLELGVSATATASINSSAFRTLAGVPSGAISVFNFYGKSNGARQWQTNTFTNISSGYITRNDYDSSGNAYVSYALAASQPWKATGQKWNATNTLQFSNTYVPTGAGSVFIGGRAYYDGSGNFCFMGGLDFGGGVAAPYVMKVNSSGTGVFAVSTNSNNGTYSASKYNNPRNMAANSTRVLLASNFTGAYISGYDYCQCPPQPIYVNTFEYWLQYYDASNGALQWLVKYTNNSGGQNYFTWSSSLINASGTPVAFAAVNQSGNKLGCLALNPSNGAVTASYYVNFPTSSEAQPPQQSIVAPNGNYYNMDYDDTGSWWLVQLAPSNFNNNWSKRMQISGASAGTYSKVGAATDSSNNVYYVGWTQYQGDAQSFLFKFNDAGTLQFCHQFKATLISNGGIFPIRVAAISISGTTMYLSFNTFTVVSGTTYPMGANLAVPTDGSAAGTTTGVAYPPTGTVALNIAITSFSPTITTSTFTTTAISVSTGSSTNVTSSYGVTTAALSSQQSVTTI